MPVSWNRQAAAITTSASRAFMPCEVTMAGSTPPRLSSLNSRSAMFTTIWMWTQEWSDMSRRSAFTCCMYHHACSRRSVLAASKRASSLRLPRVGARISVSGRSTADTLPQGECRTPRRRPRPADIGPARLRHRPLQLPLPVLHAGRRPALARPRGHPPLRGDRASGARAGRDGRDRPPPDRRRAARAARVPAARLDARRASRGSRICRSRRTATCSSATPPLSSRRASRA